MTKVIVNTTGGSRVSINGQQNQVVKTVGVESGLALQALQTANQALTIASGIGSPGAAFDKANAANVIATAAFDQANAANLLAFNTGTGANSYTAAVGAAANVIAIAAFNAANNAVTDYSPAFNKANAANVIASSAFDKANAANLLAFNTGAGANTIAIAAFLKANLGNVIASAAFDKANAANLLAFNTGAGANTIAIAAFLKANLGNVIASAAFDKANAANLLAFNTGAGANTIAIAAFNKANLANVIASAAYDAANTKFSSNGGLISGDVSITGNLTLSGNTVLLNVKNYAVEDSLIYLASNNYLSDQLVIGFVANYNNGACSTVHTGLVRDPTTKQYYLFSGYDKEPSNNNIDIAGNNFTITVLNADIKTNNLWLAGINAQSWITAAYNQANAANLLAYNTGIGANSYAAVVGGAANTIASAAFDKANSGNVIASSAFDKANAANVIAMAAFDKANIGGASLVGTYNTQIIYNNSGSANGSNNFVYDFANNRVGIGTAAPQYTLEVTGSFAAQTKSFLIEHPTKPGMKLRYGSLEGPENGVYVRGRAQDDFIELPEHWTALVHEDSITVMLTPIGNTKMPTVKRIQDNVVYLNRPWFSSIDCYFHIFAERKDVEPLIVEF